MATTDKTISAEQQARRAFAAVRGFADDTTRHALAHAEFMLAEVRHFAVCWDNHRKQHDAKEINDALYAELRKQMEDRLINSVVPTRF